MEVDGITRLYYHHDYPHCAREAYPNFRGFDDQFEIKGPKALEIYERADFICVSVREAGGRSYWSIHSPAQDDEHFESEMKNHAIGREHEEYERLAGELEQRIGKKGLTVVIY